MGEGPPSRPQPKVWPRASWAGGQTKAAATVLAAEGTPQFLAPQDTLAGKPSLQLSSFSLTPTGVHLPVFPLVAGPGQDGFNLLHNPSRFNVVQLYSNKIWLVMLQPRHSSRKLLLTSCGRCRGQLGGLQPAAQPDPPQHGAAVRQQEVAVPARPGGGGRGAACSSSHIWHSGKTLLPVVHPGGTCFASHARPCCLLSTLAATCFARHI